MHAGGGRLGHVRNDTVYQRNVSRRLQTRPKSVGGDGRRYKVRVEGAVADRDGAGSVKVAIGRWPG